jgi:Ser/Thr protein kinase RdoA (MazF antagonist)
MNRPVSLDSFLSAYPSERDRAIRPLALWPLLLVVAIVVFIVWASDGTSTPDQHMASPYLQGGIAP